MRSPLAAETSQHPRQRVLISCAVTVTVALLTAACGTPQSSASSPSTGVSPATPLLVTCGPNDAITISSDTVDAAPDGVPVQVDNNTGAATSLVQKQQGGNPTSQAYTSELEIATDLDTGTNDLVLTATPGLLPLRCGDGQSVDVRVVAPQQSAPAKP